MMDEAKIPRCPFCDSDNVGRTSVGYDGSLAAMRCFDCFAVGPHAETNEQALRLWVKAKYIG